MGSTRLPGKVLLSLGEARTLDHVLSLCEQSEFDEICVTTSREAADDAIVEWCRREGVKYVRGPESDLLRRHLMVAERTDADTIVRINGDCPFIPSEEINRVIAEHQKHGFPYTTNHADSVPNGINVDVIETDHLQQLMESGYSHPVLPLRENESDMYVTTDPEWNRFDLAELTLDTPDDYWLLNDAISATEGSPLEVAKWIEQND